MDPTLRTATSVSQQPPHHMPAAKHPHPHIWRTSATTLSPSIQLALRQRRFLRKNMSMPQRTGTDRFLPGFLERYAETDRRIPPTGSAAKSKPGSIDGIFKNSPFPGVFFGFARSTHDQHTLPGTDSFTTEKRTSDAANVPPHDWSVRAGTLRCCQLRRDENGPG